MSFFGFFNTAPRTKSDKVTGLEKAGKSALLVEAVEAERQSRKTGQQDTGNTESKIVVKRVGEHS